jgi:hypothetical protein
MAEARAIALTGEPLTAWSKVDSRGMFAIPLTRTMPLLFLVEVQPIGGTSPAGSFHVYSLAFAPRNDVSLVPVDSMTSFNAVPFLFLVTYLDEQQSSAGGQQAGLTAQRAKLQADLDAYRASTEAPDPAVESGYTSQIAAIDAQIAAIKARIAELEAAARSFDPFFYGVDVRSVTRFLAEGGAKSLLGAPTVRGAYDEVYGQSASVRFDPLSYPLFPVQ